MTTTETVLSLVIQGLAVPILTAMAWGAVRGVLLFTGWARTKVKGQKLGQAIDVFGHLMEISVRNVEAQVKPELIKASADGKLTPEEGTRLRQAAIQGVLGMASAEHRAEVMRGLGLTGEAFTEWLGGLLEARLNKVKSEGAQLQAARALADAGSQKAEAMKKLNEGGNAAVAVAAAVSP